MTNFLDSDDEFGYDLSVEDEQTLLQLSSNQPGTPDSNLLIDSVPTRTAVKSRAAVAHQDRQNAQPQASHDAMARLPRDHTRLVQTKDLPSPVSVAEDVAYPDLSRALAGLEHVSTAPSKTTAASTAAKPSSVSLDSIRWDPFDDDGRSPLQRFRSYPRRPLTVSDLTARAWCELQYWYTLTRLPGGRRTKTAAMKQGSKVHKALEDEVHTTVRIEVLTKEDAFALRLWNLVQGLRTLRETGLTRELEVWGIVDGNVVNGVIDSVSHDNPNKDLEDELSSQESQVHRQQLKVTDYFLSPQKKSAGSRHPKAYLSDVKTRGSSAPVSEVSLRPAKIQLFLYHQFLGEMAAERLDFSLLFRRYGLDADDTLSDSFMAQIGGLHDDIFADAPTSSQPEPWSSGQTTDSRSSSGLSNGNEEEEEEGSSQHTPDILKYKTLRELVSLVRNEISITFPDGEDSLGHILRVQYLHRRDGKEIDVHDFPVSKETLSIYLDRYMPWWKGEREAAGVDIEEAFKCGICEFAADCSWRQDMDQQRVRRAQEKMQAKRGRGK